MNIGLFKKSFEASIHGFSLRFKNEALENDYVAARTSLKLLSRSSRRFLLAAMAGYFAVYIIDIICAVATSPDYTYSPQVWGFTGLLIPIVIFEALCYCFDYLVPLRGTAFTVIGALVMFHNNFSNFEAKVFYPFVGTE